MHAIGVPWWHKIFSILCSSLSSIRSGGGAGKWAMDGVLIIGCKKGSIEHGVDFPHFGEMMLVHDWR